jgi:hypothetical protein
LSLATSPITSIPFPTDIATLIKTNAAKSPAAVPATSMCVACLRSWKKIATPSVVAR